MDTSAGQIVPLDEFAVLDVNASLQLSTRLELFGRVENLLDESYHEVIDFRAPARAVYLGLRVQL